MEECTTSASRCLICLGTPKQNSSINSEELLQEFLTCFHLNAPESELNDVSTSSQLCAACEESIAGWGSVQRQMAQLAQRVAQLKYTPSSALLGSAPQFYEQNPEDVVTQQVSGKRIQNNSQELQPTLPLQAAAANNIWDEPQGLTNATEDEIQCPCPPKKSNQEEFAPLTGPPGDENSSSDDSDCRDSARNAINREIPKSSQPEFLSFKWKEDDQIYTCTVCGKTSGPDFKFMEDHYMEHWVNGALLGADEDPFLSKLWEGID